MTPLQEYRARIEREEAARAQSEALQREKAARERGQALADEEALRRSRDAHPVVNMEEYERQWLARLQERARRRERRRQVDPYHLGHWNSELDD